jgi:hypothetical protein
VRQNTRLFFVAQSDLFVYWQFFALAGGIAPISCRRIACAYQDRIQINNIGWFSAPWRDAAWYGRSACRYRFQHLLVPGAHLGILLFEYYAAHSLVASHFLHQDAAMRRFTS